MIKSFNSDCAHIYVNNFNLIHKQQGDTQDPKIELVNYLQGHKVKGSILLIKSY
jgi:hypothetical protein